MSSDNPGGWHCTEVIGVVPSNTKPVFKIPITPEMLACLEAKAAKAGVTVDEYLEALFREIEEGSEGVNDG